jgi:hypothetical protein
MASYIYTYESRPKILATRRSCSRFADRSRRALFCEEADGRPPLRKRWASTRIRPGLVPDSWHSRVVLSCARLVSWSGSDGLPPDRGGRGPRSSAPSPCCCRLIGRPRGTTYRRHPGCRPGDALWNTMPKTLHNGIIRHDTAQGSILRAERLRPSQLTFDSLICACARQATLEQGRLLQEARRLLEV